MSKRLIAGLPVLLLLGCADTSDRYRDNHQLELPPELPIEHTHVQPALAADDLSPRAAKSSLLAELMDFSDGDKPRLTLKTRPDRAWEMVVVALKIGNVEVLDKNRQENRIQVRFDPDSAGREPTLLDAFFNNAYDEADYNITLREEASGVMVNAELGKTDGGQSGEDGSAELLRLLHKTIDEKIIHHQPKPNEYD
ncbi:hypothetical protein NP590_01255 [Methylomonas sp. SURF-2]|uniref:Outer membrane protein assembly factor BamC n=1 Tax=Methylomonas subterranea TaxID=2952225 RepID=A0ABT1TB81_9GAMM|nr:hypothetical protein [Methylomonas sp. SURF-2]MCQ8102716.1 hypothetical protein [Methylomonas sp. SURF-2]